MSRVLAVLGYMKARLAEASTWTGIVAAIAAAAALSQPWATFAVIAGIIAVLVPEPKKAA